MSILSGKIHEEDSDFVAVFLQDELTVVKWFTCLQNVEIVQTSLDDYLKEKSLPLLIASYEILNSNTDIKRK